MEDGNYTYLIVVGAILFGFYIFIYFVPIGLWYMAKISGVRISLLDLMFMRMRKVPQAAIVKSLIMAAKAGVIVRKDDLEAHCLAGGDIEKVVIGLITAKSRNVPLTYKEAAQMDLAMKDIIEEISE